MIYSKEFKQAMVKKMSGPNRKSPYELEPEVGVSRTALSTWLKQATEDTSTMSQKKIKYKTDTSSKNDKIPDNKSPEEKFRIITESSQLDDSKLGQFLRKEGVREIQLERWKIDALGGLSKQKTFIKPRGKNTTDAKRLKELEKELARKDKALAEAAALALLKKKPSPCGGTARNEA